MSLKKNITKRVLAALAAVSMMFTAAGCGEGTSWAAKYGDYTANAGVFTYYQMEALKEAKSIIKEQDATFDVTDVKKLKSMTVEGVDIEEWVNNKAKAKLRKFIAVTSKFDELKLELSADDIANINYYVEYGWMYGEGETCEKIGTSMDSYRQIIEMSYKEKQVFSYYYGEGGEKECSAEDYNKYLADSLARVKMIKLELKDSEGNELDAAGKAEVKAAAEEYLKRANAGESMDDLIEEYSKLKEEEAADSEEDEISEAGTEADGTAEDSESSDAVSEEPAVTTESENAAEEPEITTAAEESNDEPAVTTVPDNNEDKPEVTEEVTTAAESAEEPVVTTADEENASEEPAVTTEAEDTSEPEEIVEETDDSADPYKNENLYFKGSEEEGYNPSQKVNEAIFNDCKVGGDAVLVEDEENSAIYVISRLDIVERKDFTENGDYKDLILWKMFEDEFALFEDGWLDESKMKNNNAAFRRYDAFKSVE